MFKNISSVLITIFLFVNIAQGQEKPAFHITTVTVAPKDGDTYKEQLKRLTDLLENEQLGVETMVGTYRTGNKWTFVSLRPNGSLFGKTDSVILNAIKDTSSITTYKKVTDSFKQIDIKVDRHIIQQVNEWSYAPAGTPEHDRFAIVQEWNLNPIAANFDELMQEMVAWAEETKYPYVFDTYYTVEEPWKITFVTWVNSLDTYFLSHSIGALDNANEKITKLRNRLNSMLIDYKSEVNLMMPEYSYFPQQ